MSAQGLCEEVGVRARVCVCVHGGVGVQFLCARRLLRRTLLDRGMCAFVQRFG